MFFEVLFFCNHTLNLSYPNSATPKVTQMSQVPGIGIILQVESIHKESHCHHCGTKSNRLHQNHRYVVKDLGSSLLSMLN